VRDYRFKNSSPRIGIFGLMMFAAFLGGLLVLLAVRYTGLGDYLADRPPVQEEPDSSTRVLPGPNVTDFESATIQVVEKVGPAVVMITTTRLIEVSDFFGFIWYPQEVQGLGSGVIFRKEGYILTNHHVIKEAREIRVILPDGRTFPARVIGADQYTDLAVLKIEGENLPVADFGDSDELRVGQLAIAIGNPIGEGLKNTVTTGVISALERTLDLGNNVTLRDVIQTDASINPGNSGGPLLNSRGEVIGINTAIIQDAQGIGFAIPANKAREIAGLLIAEGRVPRAGIGITYMPFDATNRRQVEARFRIRLPVDEGFLITHVVSGGPAAKAGLRPGDVVVEINRQKVSMGTDFQGLDLRVGDRVLLGIQRGSRRMEVEIVAEELRSS
jgi:serine protease Do